MVTIIVFGVRTKKPLIRRAQVYGNSFILMTNMTHTNTHSIRGMGGKEMPQDPMSSTLSTRALTMLLAKHRRDYSFRHIFDATHLFLAPSKDFGFSSLCVWVYLVYYVQLVVVRIFSEFFVRLECRVKVIPRSLLVSFGLLTAT